MAKPGTPPDLLHGLDWALPRAFRDPVAAARFEQGDILYRDAEGYAPGATRLPAIQVIEPPRSTRTAGGGGEGGRFAANWRSPVVLDLYVDDPARPERRTTTQGRLFDSLWHGDLGRLDGDAEPPVPLQARDLQRVLESSLPALRKVVGRCLAREGGSLFVMVRDDASETSGAKVRAIEHRLAARYSVERVARSLADAGIEDAHQYHPSLLLEAFGVARATPEQITDELRPLLYGGKGDGEGARFSLGRHGWLEAVDASSGKHGRKSS